MNSVIAMMLGVSVFLAFCATWALVWGIRNKQFDDYEKFLGGTKYDSEEALNDAYKMEQRKKEALRCESKTENKADKEANKIANKEAPKGYRPPD